MADLTRKTANLIPTSVSNYEQGSISSIDGTDTDSATRIRTIDYYPIDEDTDYYITVDNASYCYLNLIFYDVNKQFAGQYYTIDSNINGATSLKINIDSSIVSNVKYFRATFRKADNTNIVPQDIASIKPMINIGSTALPYEPYWKHSLRKYTTAAEIVENPLYADGTDITAYTIKGNTVQSGTPTPSNPITISGVGNKTANSLNNSNFLQGGWDAAAGTTPEANQRSNRCRYSYFFSILSPTVYYDFKDLNVNIVMVDSNGVSLGGSDFRTGTGSFTVLNNTDKISLIIANTDLTQNITPEYVQSKNISLDYGYEIPISSGGVTTNIYLNEPLYKIGDTTDNYVSSGTATYNVAKYEFKGNENITKVNSTATNYLYYIVLTDTVTGGAMCSHLQYLSSGVADNIGFSQNQTYPNTFYFNLGADIMNAQTSGNTAEGFKEWLTAQYAAGTPLTLYRCIATPTTETVTAPSIPTTEGANSITVDTTVQPSEFSATWTGWHDSSVKEYDGSQWQ